MKVVPAEIIEKIKEIARERGSTYLVSYEMFQQGTGKSVGEGHISIIPGMELDEVFATAAMSDDLRGHELRIAEVFNLKTNEPVKDFPKLVKGLPAPGKAMN